MIDDVPFCILQMGLNVIAVQVAIGFKANHQDEEQNVEPGRYLNELHLTITDLMERAHGAVGKPINEFWHKQ